MSIRHNRKVATVFEVQEAVGGGRKWKTVFRGNEADATTVFERQLELNSAGRFRLLGPDGHDLEDRHAQPKVVC